jgi:SAM-dependent methyltransferase
MAMYRDDLAYVHHAGFGDFARGAAPGLLRLLRAAGIRSGTVVDLGCGSGLWLRALGRAGFAAVGVDRSAALLAIARRTAPRAELHRRSVYDFELPRCDAVTALGEVLSYVEPGGGSTPPLRPFFRRVARALRPGGLFVFDVLVAARRPMAYRSWRAGGSWLVAVDVAEERGRGRLVREITTFRRAGAHWRRAHERHVQRVLARAEVAGALRAAGFSLRVSRRYGRMELPPRRLAFVARKR